MARLEFGVGEMKNVAIMGTRPVSADDTRSCGYLFSHVVEEKVVGVDLADALVVCDGIVI